MKKPTKKKILSILRKDLWIIVLDIISVNAAYILALLIRFYVNFKFRPTVLYYLQDFLHFAPFYTVLAILTFALFRLYGGLWRYAGLNDMNRIIGANAVTNLIQIIGTALFIRRMPISYYMIGAVLQFGFIVAIRFSYRILMVEKKKIASRSTPAIPAIIIGAGETGRKIIRNLDDASVFRAAAILDEEGAGKTFDGVPVLDGSLEEAVHKYKARAVFIADARMTPQERKEIKDFCEKNNLEIQDYTGFMVNLGGRVPLTALLESVKGPVTVRLDQEVKTYNTGEEALHALTERYEVVSVEGMTVEIRKPMNIAYAGYDAWVEQYKKETGEDLSFF